MINNQEDLVNLFRRLNDMDKSVLSGRDIVRDDLSMLLNRCLHHLNKHSIAPSLCKQAEEYLSRHTDLMAVVLRNDGGVLGEDE